MDLPSETSTPSLWGTVPDLCAKCRQTDWFASHTYSASSCPYKLCPECCELEELDAQIMDARNALVNLFKKRHELKVRINCRHDRFTSILPMELISDIFALITEGSKNRQRPAKKDELVWNPVLALGAVCRRWRDITLNTPQLWTELIIVPRKHSARTDIAQQWLSRFCGLPLTLEVRGKREDDDMFSEQFSPTVPYENLVQLLRSHANRWKDLTLGGPLAMFQMLLAGLEDKLSVNLLKIFLYDTASHGRDKIIMDYPFAPQRLLIDAFPLRQIPIQWGRLTHLEADYITSDALVHIFRHAHNLQDCLLHTIQMDAGHYPILISPVTNTSVKHFKATRKGFQTTFPLILPHLTLPSLETLDCAVEYVDTNLNNEIAVLVDFIDRSQPPLHNFVFSYFDYDWRMNIEWYRLLPFITSLKVRVYEDENGQRIQGYLEALSAHEEPIALPCLRQLTIEAEEWNAHCWDALAAMFPDPEHHEVVEPVNRRPLHAVKIRLDVCFEIEGEFAPGKIIPEGIYTRLCTIQKSSVTLQVFDRNGFLILGSAAPPTSCLTDDESSD